MKDKMFYIVESGSSDYMFLMLRKKMSSSMAFAAKSSLLALLFIRVRVLGGFYC